MSGSLLGHTQVLPIEGVYGVIEVKSRLSKAELADALKKLASFKLMNPPYFPARIYPSDVQRRQPSAPFGIVVGFELADNCLYRL